MQNILKIGSVPYLNAKPLVETLKGNHEVRLLFAPPVRLATWLAQKKVDAAILPTAEFLRHPEYIAVGNTAIASHGKTDSVRLYHKVKISNIRTIALDADSVTSNALARVLLQKRYGLHPRYMRHNTLRSSFLKRKRLDAAVTIGDPSFHFCKLDYLDLGREWFLWTQSPFVYAVWALWRNHPARWKLSRLLRQARERGLARVDAIARREAKRLRLTPQFCKEYLTHSMVYDFGKEEKKGLKLFGRYLEELRLLS